MTEFKLLLELNQIYVDQITERVIRHLKHMKDKSMLQSGDDSGLKNVWEEYCVQVQEGESFFWESYQQVISQSIILELNKQPQPIKRVISYIGGLDMFMVNDEDQEDQLVYCEETAIKGVLDEILNRASNYTNTRIEHYQEDRIEFDGGALG